MTIRTSINALQALHRSIPGIKTASDEFPDSIDTSSMPLVLIWPDSAKWARKGASAPAQQDRVYLVQVFVAPGSASINDGTQPMIDLLQAFGDAYTNPANIALANGPYQVTLRMGTDGETSDDGAAVLTYAGQSYHGFQFRIKIHEHNNTT